MNVGLRGSTTPKKPGQGGSAAGSGNPDNSARTSSRVPILQGAGGINPGVVIPMQMIYVVGSQSQVPRSPSKSPPDEGGYPDTPSKKVSLSPLIDSDNEDALQRVVEGIGSGGGPSGPSGGGAFLKCEDVN
jgi:hypothetical protein